MMRNSILIFSVLFLFKFTDNYAQIIRTKLDFTGGLGYPEFFHAGLRYQYANKGQLGFYYGGDMGMKPIIIRTWTGDNFIHFGKHSYTSNRPAWYARQGFTYSIHNTADIIYYYSYIDLAVGREIGITDWLGFNIDLGLIGQIREKRVFKGIDHDSVYRTKWEWDPLLRFQVFISI